MTDQINFPKLIEAETKLLLGEMAKIQAACTMLVLKGALLPDEREKLETLMVEQMQTVVDAAREAAKRLSEASFVRPEKSPQPEPNGSFN